MNFAYAVIAFLLVAAFATGNDGRWWLGLGDAVSLVYGGLLVVAPRLGDVVMTGWLGTYALSVVLLAAAFKLKGHRAQQILQRRPRIPTHLATHL